MSSRRQVLSGLASLALSPTLDLLRPSLATAQTLAMAELRGGFDASDAGILPGAEDDQSRKLQALLDAAAKAGQPVFLPAGTYEVANLELPEGTRLTGVPGLTRLSYRGDGHLIAAQDVKHVSLSGITFDGANRWLADYTEGLLSFRNIGSVVIEDCAVTGSRKYGLHLAQCGGRIERCRVSGAALSAVWAIEGKAFAICDNEILDCGNGGILVHRWTKGEDGTVISGNRVARIGAAEGGTGQNGNGINLFRADNVIVAGNHISDCAFSAIRANSASNVSITGNQCFRSGETAIYAEFAFEGALIGDNVIDGAANGICVVNFDQGGHLATVSGNIIRHLVDKGPYRQEVGGFGFGISVEADTVVLGNVIEDAATAGMQLGWGPYLRNLVVSGNIVRKARTGMRVSVVEGAGQAVISGNILQEIKDGAILGYRWAERSTGDLISDAGGYAHLAISGNRSS
ncbi:TIGR03808 family TAT-translocated repetitive protein [Rhizobium glycinendophyticum]|uniref:TIGR03808 family TAT-translocated repetitive protein n=1 Tax=Rhizobium glycinendophyticum TaxID=2589807 RepID=A0A504UA03_9HYPH|nr:TIGR03808 family TAT-translocated repetitive protein [Rhizobium glycinendophyticum]TPP12044.1 TIGR03808 family TAT-translocated repetitive protein [Rhizobium glycinendophyticum]